MIEFPSPPGPQENWPDGWEWTGFGWGRVLDRSSQGTEVIIAETPPLPVVDKALYFDNSPTAKRARLFLGYQKAWVATDPIRDRGSGGGNGTSLADVEYWLTNPDNGWIWDNVVTSVNDERGAVTITPEGLTPEQTEVIEWLSDNSTVDSSGIHFTLPLWSDGGFHTMNPQLLTYTEQSMASVWWVEQQGYYSEANPPPGVNGGPVVTISESRPDPASVPFWWDPNKSSTQSRLFISYDGDWVAVDPITDRGGGDGGSGTGRLEFTEAWRDDDPLLVASDFSWGTITQITLGAGTWMVSGEGNFHTTNKNNNDPVYINLTLSTQYSVPPTDGMIPGGWFRGMHIINNNTAATVFVGPTRFQGPATIYLIAAASYTPVATASLLGHIWAWRTDPIIGIGGDGGGTTLTEVQDWVNDQNYVTQTALPLQIRSWISNPDSGVYTETNPPPPSATQPPIFSSFWFPGAVAYQTKINIVISTPVVIDGSYSNAVAGGAASSGVVFSVNKISGGTTTNITDIVFTANNTTGSLLNVPTPITLYPGDILQASYFGLSPIYDVSITIGMKRTVLPEPDIYDIWHVWSINNLPSQPGPMLMSGRDWTYPAGTYDITFTVVQHAYNLNTMTGPNEGGRAETTYSVWLTKVNNITGDTGFSPEITGSATVISDGSNFGGPELIDYSFGPFRTTFTAPTTIYARGQHARTANNPPGTIYCMCIIKGEAKRIY